MGLSPSFNDRPFDLWFKIAQNYYDTAISGGASGLNPPNLNDTVDTLLKKICYYTAVMA